MLTSAVVVEDKNNVRCTSQVFSVDTVAAIPPSLPVPHEGAESYSKCFAMSSMVGFTAVADPMCAATASQSCRSAACLLWRSDLILCGLTDKLSVTHHLPPHSFAIFEGEPRCSFLCMLPSAECGVTIGVFIDGFFSTGDRQAAVGLPGFGLHLAGHAPGGGLRHGSLAVRQPER